MEGTVTISVTDFEKLRKLEKEAVDPKRVEFGNRAVELVKELTRGEVNSKAFINVLAGLNIAIIINGTKHGSLNPSAKVFDFQNL